MFAIVGDMLSADGEHLCVQLLSKLTGNTASETGFRLIRHL